MNLLKTLFLKASGKLSKSKLTALIGAVINVLQTYHVVTFTPEQLASVNALLLALFAIFLRDGVDEAASPR